MIPTQFRTAILGLVLLCSWAPSVQAFHTWKKHILPNGMTLLVVEQRDVPAMSLTLLVKHGTTSDPADKRGLASLTARLLTAGTRHWSRAQIAERIAAVGGVFKTDVGFDDTTIEWAVLKQDLTPTLEVLAEVVQRPVFPRAGVERERRVESGPRTPMVENTPETLMLRALFGNGFSGVPPSGDRSAMPRIGRRDVVQFHRRAYRPADTILAAVGDVTLAELTAIATTSFGDWTPTYERTPAPTVLSVKTTPTTIVVDRPLAQASLRLAFVGTSETEPTMPALKLLTYVLANGPESRLGSALREQRGWTYSVRSELDTFRHAGVFSIRMSVPYEVVLPTIQQSARELACLTRTPITAGELARAKQQMAREFSAATETLPDLSHFIAKYEALHAGQEPSDRLLATFDAITIDDLHHAAQRYLDPQKAVLTVVGDRSILKKVAPQLVAGKLPHWVPRCTAEGQ